MKKFFYLFILAISLTFTACDNDSNSNEPEDKKSDVLIPLAVGNWWASTTTVYNQDGSTDFVTNDTTVITDLIEIEGRTWYKAVTGANDYFEYQGNQNDGFYFYEADEELIELYYKYPIEIGETFKDWYYVEWSLASQTEKITTDRGEFQCYKYVGMEEDMGDDKGSFTYYYEYYICPGIGEIKLQTYMKYDDEEERFLRSETILTDYHIED